MSEPLMPIVRHPIEAPTPRQLEYLRCWAAGENIHATSMRLGVAPETVRIMRRTLRRRLNAVNAPHAIAIAFRAGWLE